MNTKTVRHGLTLIELMVCLAVISFLGGYAWKIYFGGSESMRHTVSQTQMQSDMRILLDQLEQEMGSCYSFDTVDTEEKYFSFYSFTYNNTPLDVIFYDNSGKPRATDKNSDAKIMTVKYEYRLDENGNLLKSRVPGYLFFLKEPMFFEPSTAPEFDFYKPYAEHVMLKDLADMEVRCYSQKRNLANGNINIQPLEGDKAQQGMFITLRLHAKSSERGDKRNEEMDIVTKFYSNFRLAEAANPNSFSSTDHNGTF